MARIVARNAGIVFGARDISARSNTAALSLSTEAPEVTCFTETTRTRVPGGLSDAELTVDGFWDSAASQVDEIFSASLGASGMAGFYPQSTDASMKGYEFSGILSRYNSNAAVAGAVTTAVTLTGCAPLLRSHVLLSASVALTSGSNECPGVDFGAATAATGQTVWWIMRVMSEAATLIAASAQSSADDAAWVTQGEFASQTVANTISIITSTSAGRHRRFRCDIDGNVSMLVTCGSLMVS